VSLEHLLLSWYPSQRSATGALPSKRDHLSAKETIFLRQRPSFCRKKISSPTRVARKRQLSDERTLPLVLEAHRLLYHSTLGLRVIKKKKKNTDADGNERPYTLNPRPDHHHSSLISSLLHARVNLEWCEKIKLSNLTGPDSS